MATDYGRCIACVLDVGARFAFVSGPAVVGQALARRLTTPRGRLRYDLAYGTDMRDYLSHGGTPQGRLDAQQAAESECLKDDRVQAVSLDVAFNFTTQTLALTITGTLVGDVAFRLVIAVSALTVELLEAA